MADQDKDDFTEPRSGKFPASPDCSCTSFAQPTSVSISGLINDHGNGTYVKLVDVIDFIREHHEQVVGADAMVVMLRAKFGSGDVTTMRVDDAATAKTPRHSHAPAR